MCRQKRVSVLEGSVLSHNYPKHDGGCLYCLEVTNRADIRW